MLKSEFFDYIEETLQRKLTPAQMDVVTYNDGHLSVQSTAGSGKTFVITTKIAYLIKVLQYKPDRIMVTSFSKMSAADIKDRFYRMYGELVPEEVTFSTIHSFAYTIVRYYEKMTKAKYTIIEDSKTVDKNKILNDIFRKYSGRNLEDEESRDLVSYITYIRNMMIYYNELDKYEGDFPIPYFKKVYKAYSEYLNKNKFLDYDSILTMAHHILSKYEPIRTYFQGKYDYYLNDESQDNSKIQNAIIYQLAKDKLCCYLGDTDQTIYSWRGVDFKEFNDFQNIFPGAKVLFMDQCFRCSGNIIKLANEFIKKNQNRYDKNIYTNNKLGPPVSVGTLIDEEQQVNYIIKSIKSGKKDYKECAVLYRNNISAIAVISKLHNAGIPFYIKDNLESFFNYSVVKDILAFFKLAINPSDMNAFKYICYKCGLYIKKDIIMNTVMRKGEGVFDALARNKDLNEFVRARILDLKVNFELLTKMSPVRAIDFIQESLNYKKYLEDKITDCRMMEKVDSVIGILKIVCSSADSIALIEDKLLEINTLISDSKKNNGKSAVTLTTVHSSKGLEWDATYLIDLHNFPSKSAIDNLANGDIAEMEEEVRAFFVAVTRAREELHIIQVKTYNGNPITTSPFIDDVKNILEGKPKGKNFYIKNDNKAS